MSDIAKIIALGKVKSYDPNADGVVGRVYVDPSNSAIYLWNGTQYTLVASSSALRFKGVFDAINDPVSRITTELTADGDAFIVDNASTSGTVINIDGTDYTVFIGSFIVKTETAFAVVNEEHSIFRNIDDNRIPRIVNGSAVNSALIETADEIISDKTIRTPPGSVEVGASVSLSEIGGFISSESLVSGDKFIQLDYELEDSGTSDPIYYSRGARQNNVVTQPIDTTVMNNVTTYTVTPTQNEDIIAVYLDNANALTNFRFKITSGETNNDIKFFPSEAEWRNGTGQTVTIGKNRFATETPLAELAGVTFTITLMADQQINLNGDGTNIYRAVDRQVITNITMAHNDNLVSLLDAKTGTDRLSFRSLKERSTVTNTQSNSLSITSGNVETYRDNAILFNADSASDLQINITDGVFNNDDELTVMFYPATDVNDGLLTIQAGATGTINGDNTIVMLRNTVLKIKHISGDDWRVIFEDSHPITVRRDTPNVSQMRALLRSSINENSALWFVANDQILANEQAISNTIFIEALRDDLLDLNGNPIPTTATQKNITGVLLEAGTICRIFSSTPTQSIIRVVFTPERSSSQSRIETEATSTTITSSNVAEYKNDLILFTNASGVEDLIIQDDVFDVNDEITIKHFTSTPNMNIGVDVQQQGAGAEIDGATTIELRGNTAIRIKYIGNNKWRVISGSGMGTSGGAPTTLVADVHHFSINIPSRITPNQSPDPVNGTRRVNFSVTNHDLITSMSLHIGTDTFAMTVPTSDGDQFQDIAVSGIDITTVSNQNMFIRLNNDSSLDSNIQVLRIANPVVHERLYWDIQSTNVASSFNYQSATAQGQDITGNENIFTVPTFTGNMYLAIAQPASETEFTDIFVNGFAQGGAFTKTDNAVQINSVNYDVWVSNNALVGSIVSGDTIRVVR